MIVRSFGAALCQQSATTDSDFYDLRIGEPVRQGYLNLEKVYEIKMSYKRVALYQALDFQRYRVRTVLYEPHRMLAVRLVG